jgi:hypothetical protein
MSNPLPLLNPPALLTPHGQKMSVRQARLYQWLRARGVSLTPFSTDANVAGQLDALGAARAQLSNLVRPAGASGPLPESILGELIGDLDTIMRRVPSARVTRATATKPAASASAASAAEDLDATIEELGKL